MSYTQEDWLNEIARKAQHKQELMNNQARLEQETQSNQHYNRLYETDEKNRRDDFVLARDQSYQAGLSGALGKHAYDDRFEDEYLRGLAIYNAKQLQDAAGSGVDIKQFRDKVIAGDHIPDDKVTWGTDGWTVDKDGNKVPKVTLKVVGQDPDVHWTPGYDARNAAGQRAAETQREAAERQHQEKMAPPEAERYTADQERASKELEVKTAAIIKQIDAYTKMLQDPMLPEKQGEKIQDRLDALMSELQGSSPDKSLTTDESGPGDLKDTEDVGKVIGEKRAGDGKQKEKTPKEGKSKEEKPPSQGPPVKLPPDKEFTTLKREQSQYRGPFARYGIIALPESGDPGTDVVGDMTPPTPPIGPPQVQPRQNIVIGADPNQQWASGFGSPSWNPFLWTTDHRKKNEDSFKVFGW